VFADCRTDNSNSRVSAGNDISQGFRLYAQPKRQSGCDKRDCSITELEIIDTTTSRKGRIMAEARARDIALAQVHNLHYRLPLSPVTLEIGECSLLNRRLAFKDSRLPNRN
jgi:hypothetical protein